MQRAGGATVDEANSISLDDSSNTYTTGYFTGSATFGSTILNATGISDIFVTKTNSKGIFQWTVHAGGGSDRGLAIKADANGNSYVTGFYYGTATFGSSTITSAGLQDVFIAKYDRNGKLLWVKSAGGSKADIGNAITVDNSGNVIVTGEFAGTATFGSFTLTSTKNNVNVFTTELDPSGNFLWAKGGTGPHTNRGLGVAADPIGNVYVTGQFTDTITFDVTHFSVLYDAIFLVKYNSSGKEKWFTKAGGGTMNIANGIAADNSSNIYLTGDFTGVLSFYGSSIVTLTNTYFNKIFVAKYDTNGNLLWDVADGSSSAVTSRSISLDGSGNAYIAGNFECRFNGYADQYGQGTFNTVGSWDIFTAEYGSAAGAWQWSRQIGGHKDNIANGIAVNTSDDVFTAGSFNQDMICTSDPSFIGYNTTSAFCNGTYCSDAYYGNFAYFNTAGNSDIFIAKPFDLTRQPYDFYIRSGSSCIRPVVGVCINNGCPDTVISCGSGAIIAVSNTCYQVGPNYTYLWKPGNQTGSSIGVATTGWYSVTQTTADGCFSSKDSIYIIIHPIPAKPNISDNVVINTNATSPKPIEVCLKPVILTGGGYGSSSYFWSNGSTTSPTVSITVTTNGTYCFNVKDTFGCVNQTCVNVIIDSLLKPIKPGMICLTCTNDSVKFCRGGSFTMFVFDSITNPSMNPSNCIPPIPYTTLHWYATPGTVSYSSVTTCPNTNSFTPMDSAKWYHITDTIIIKNQCDTDKYVVHDSVYVTLWPIPNVTIGPLSITPSSASICPGDSVLLTASGKGYTWSNGSTQDSMWVKPGTYSISAKKDSINKYGCKASASAGASATVTLKTPPVITVTPSVGVICPNDSLRLSCTGVGKFQWYGPGGKIGKDTTISYIYVKAPGSYYCVVSDTNYKCAPVLSNTVLVELYATPYWSVPPKFVLCPGGSVKITLFTQFGDTIQWQAPLSGSDTVKTITTPGTYSCKITSCGLPITLTTTVIIATPLAEITASGPTTFCASDSVILTANSGMASYVWNPGGISAPSITVTSSGIYTLVTKDTNGCTANDTSKVTVTTNTTTTPLASNDTVCPGSSAVLLASGTGSIEWYSSSGGGTPVGIGTTFTTPPITTSTIYYVVADVAGCKSKRKPVTIDTMDCRGIFVPNVFTPNGDGSNDVFKITVKDAKCFDCKIYNRWGVLIYQWNDANRGWVGRTNSGVMVSDGTYYYIVNYCDYKNVPGTKDGFITLIR